MRAAMALESTPPLRNMPSGTSLMSRVRTASSSRSLHSAIHSLSVRLSNSLGHGESQYGLISSDGLLPQSRVRVLFAGKQRLLTAVVPECEILGEQLFVGLCRDIGVL